MAAGCISAVQDSYPHRLRVAVRHRQRQAAYSHLQSDRPGPFWAARLHESFPLLPHRAYLRYNLFRSSWENVREGIQFRGVAYESERPEIRAEVPKEGLDVQHEPVYEA